MDIRYYATRYRWLPANTGNKINYPNIPVIFISARDADIDRVLGLELGSDDYLPKPFFPRELVIRTKNLLERVYGPKLRIHQYSTLYNR